MNAFIKTENGLFKVYKRDQDWQVVGPKFERWFSVWSADVLASLRRAINAVPGNDPTVEIVKLTDAIL